MKVRKLLAYILTITMFSGLLQPFTVEAENDRVTSIMETMTLKDKILQMMMVDFRQWDEDLTDETPAQDFVEMNEQVREIVEDYNFGAFIYFANNIKGTEQSYQLTMDMQEAATKDGGIPMLIGADQEGGSVYRLGSGTALPGNMALGATGDVNYTVKAGEIVGSELSALGMNLNLAPVVDVNNNANNPVIGLRSYGDDAQTVGVLASAFVKGMDAYNVIGCAKHFPGHGDTATDSHYGLPSVDKAKEVLQENELKPYEVAIAEGIDMIMTAHTLYPQLDDTKIFSEKTGQEESVPATMSEKIITGLLKEEMEFGGIVITDSMVMDAIDNVWNPTQAVVNAINAGVDMICMPCVIYDLEDMNDFDTIVSGVEDAVVNGVISEDRINDAVKRILTVKEERGVLDYTSDNYSLEKSLSIVGSNENRAAERKMAAAAVTVVKNENEILPLKLNNTSKVLMLCPYNNERAQLVMGWNRAVEARLIPDGAQMDYYRYSGEEITEEIQEKLDWADIFIILSEISSASKMSGKHWLSKGPEAFSNYAKENEKQAIVISVDKPYDVQLYENADAILAVYGCKGSTVDPTEAMNGNLTDSAAACGPNITAGVEVLFGVFGATGKLPVNIPVFDAQAGIYTEEIVYERGYGLTYDAVKESVPSTPIKPIKPEKPQKPDKPQKPEKPDKPQKPEKPQVPEKPEIHIIVKKVTTFWKNVIGWLKGKGYLEFCGK